MFGAEEFGPSVQPAADPLEVAGRLVVVEVAVAGTPPDGPAWRRSTRPARAPGRREFGPPCGPNGSCKYIRVIWSVLQPRRGSCKTVVAPWGFASVPAIGGIAQSGDQERADLTHTVSRHSLVVVDTEAEGEFGGDRFGTAGTHRVLPAHQHFAIPFPLSEGA